VLFLVKSKSHLTEQGLNQILEIKSGIGHRPTKPALAASDFTTITDVSTISVAPMENGRGCLGND
jgi:hypothetical protein